jgi:hypothetical protein
MPERKMWVEWDDDADLSRSRKKPGAYSPLTRDGDNNLGHVTLRDVDDDEDEYDWETDPEPDPEPLFHVNADGELVPTQLGEVVLAAVYGVILAARWAAPHVKRWWTDQAVPFLKKSGRRLSRDRGADDQVSVEESLAEYFMLPQSAPTESSQEVVAALDEYRASLSSAEARERLVAAVVARLYSEEQLRILSNAQIEDDGTALELASAMQTFTPQQLGESITLMLEANPAWPDKETLAELERILERRSRGDGGYVLVRSGGINEPLRLPPGGE